MRKFLNKKIILVIIILITISIIPTNVHAGLQANKNGTSKVSETASRFFSLIKGMETGTLGLDEINAQDGIDCHMAKNTEWGTAAILSACWGIIPTGNASTTGNESGIYQMAGGNTEYVAGVFMPTTSDYATYIIEDQKYYDKYTGDISRNKRRWSKLW